MGAWAGQNPGSWSGRKAAGNERGATGNVPALPSLTVGRPDSLWALVLVPEDVLLFATVLEPPEVRPWLQAAGSLALPLRGQPPT